MGEVELFEVYPNSDEWNAVLKASGLIDGTRACVVSISSVKVLVCHFFFFPFFSSSLPSSFLSLPPSLYLTTK